MPRILLLASRLPVEYVGGAEGWRESAGGVASLLRAVARHRSALWIGSAGGDHPAETPPRWADTPLVPVRGHDFRDGLANRTLWPLHHGLPAQVSSPERLWHAYVEANAAFARAALAESRPGDAVWVNDYQLQLAPELIRRRRTGIRVGFCFYIPFPEPDAFQALPMWRDLLRGVLGADVVGLQTESDRRHFLGVVAKEYPLSGDLVTVGSRRVRVGCFPCSIDVAEIEGHARAPGTAAKAATLRERLGYPRLVLSSAERLDYTKGIDRRLAVLPEMLRDGSLDAAGTAIVQLAEPTRATIGSYRDYARDIARRVDEINAEFPPGPVTYLNTRFDREMLSALYLATDVMVVTPLRDGMNLVAKEYVTSRLDDTGALVLSRHAGSAEELPDAYLVDPEDPASLRDGIVAAVMAVPHKGAERMARMRSTVRRHDIHRWVDSFLGALDT